MGDKSPLIAIFCQEAFLEMGNETFGCAKRIGASHQVKSVGFYRSEISMRHTRKTVQAKSSSMIVMVYKKKTNNSTRFLRNIAQAEKVYNLFRVRKSMLVWSLRSYR